MYNLNKEIGIKSYSFRAIEENTDVAAAVKACGASTIDLSACHVNYDDQDAQERTIKIYREAGIRISGIGVVGAKDDEAFNRRFFEFARRAGCDVVSCSFGPEGHEAVLAMLERLCGEYDMRAAIHNHGGKHWLGNATILKYLLEKSGSSIGLCLDTAWCLQAGENPVAWLDAFGDRLYGVHFKDFIFSRDGAHTDVVVGQGALDLPAFLEKFRTLPFNGSAVIEYEGDDAVGQSQRCVEAIRAAK